MKTIYLEQPKKHVYLNILLASIFLAQGILNLVNQDGRFSIGLGIAQILLALFYGFLLLITFRPKSAYAPRITLGSNSIELKKGFFSKKRIISLDDIKLVQLKPEKLTLITKEYDFAHSFPYESLNKHLIMDQIADFAKSNNLPIERVPYRNV